jgi:hypothetical protein
MGGMCVLSSRQLLLHEQGQERVLELEQLADGCVRVCLVEGQTRVCTTVSSMHLVEDKRKQLEKAAQDRETA